MRDARWTLAMCGLAHGLSQQVLVAGTYHALTDSTTVAGDRCCQTCGSHMHSCFTMLAARGTRKTGTSFE
jgi:hypothetical protein